MQQFINKHPEICAISLLTVLCLFFLFFGINFYPILDTPESLYASVAKNILVQDDFNLLVLNMQPFLEKPPLYFWLISNSIKLLETFNEFSVRLPNVFICALLIFYTYFSGKKILSRKFGLVNAVILLTSLAFLIFSHIVILNMALTVFITFALYNGFLTSISEDKYKKYYWWAFYFFCALSVLIKGALGIILPFLVMSIYYAYLKNIKEVFKPINFIVGLLIFLPITIPWYFEMIKIFGISFLHSHFFIPEFQNFFKYLFYFLLLFVPAFMPWIFIFIGYIYDSIKKFVLRFKNNAKFNAITVEQKISLFGFITFFITLITISLLPLTPSMVLLLVPPAAFLTSYFLCAKDISDFYKVRTLSISTHILAILFTVSTITFAFVYMFFPLNIFEQVQQFKNFLIIGINFLSILLLLRLKNKNIFSTISTYVFSMFFILIFTLVHVFNMFYMSGENELVKFSQYTKNKDSKLVTFNIPTKPSVLINSNDYVHFIETPDVKKLISFLDENKSSINFIIFKNKDLIYLNNEFKNKDLIYLNNEFKNKDLIYLIERGNKYSLYSTVQISGKSISINKFYNE